jgi:RNA polymerase sigma-70 factor, ECF subfamily
VQPIAHRWPETHARFGRRLINRSARAWIHERGPADWKPDGEEAMKRAEFWEAMRGCLERLPQRLAQVFMMREIDDAPSKEVCEALNISEAPIGTVMSKLFKGKAQLKSILLKNIYGAG